MSALSIDDDDLHGWDLRPWGVGVPRLSPSFRDRAARRSATNGARQRGGRTTSESRSCERSMPTVRIRRGIVSGAERGPDCSDASTVLRLWCRFADRRMANPGAGRLIVRWRHS